MAAQEAEAPLPSALVAALQALSHNPQVDRAPEAVQGLLAEASRAAAALASIADRAALAAAVE